MDTLKGKRDTKKVILVLTERLTRNEIKIPMASNTIESVLSSLNTLERRYGEMFPVVFQSITVDNGSEFADCVGMEKSCIHEGQRTKVYYCHPYSSWERGSNENQNKLIRRWIPKGTPIENYTDEEIKKIESWINSYPRRILDGRAAVEVFQEHVAALCWRKPLPRFRLPSTSLCTGKAPAHNKAAKIGDCGYIVKLFCIYSH